MNPSADLTIGVDPGLFDSWDVCDRAVRLAHKLRENTTSSEQSPSP